MQETKICSICKSCQRYDVCNHKMFESDTIEQCCTEFATETKREMSKIEYDLNRIEKLFFEPKKTVIAIGNMKYPEFVKFSSKVSNEHYEYEVIHQLLLHYQISSDKSMFEIIDSMQLGKFKDFIKELLEREVIRL